MDIFGVESTGELEDTQQLPAFVPVEGPRPELLTALLEQIRYERTDGPTLPTRVVLSTSTQAKKILAEELVEDSAN